LASKLTRAAMTRKRQAALVDAVLNLEKPADGKELIRLLRAGSRWRERRGSNPRPSA
jgi:hypothetical protein